MFQELGTGRRTEARGRTEPAMPQTPPGASVSPLGERSPRPQRGLGCRLGLQGPAPVVPGFRCPGHVLRAPPEAPAGRRGGGGGGGGSGGGAEVGCTSPRPPRPPSTQGLPAVPRPPPPLPARDAPAPAGSGGESPKCRPRRVRPGTWSGECRTHPGLTALALAAGGRGTPGVRSSLDSRGRCSLCT